MNRPWLRCLAPVIGIFLGSLLGWITDALLHPVGVASFAVRLFMIVFGIFGWAVATIVDGKQLHCGGTLKLDRETRQRYRLHGIIAFFLVVLAPMLLFTQLWFLYFPCMFVLIVCFVSEVGWGSPTKVLDLTVSQGPQ